MSFTLPNATVSVMELQNFGAMYDLHTFMWDSGDCIGGVVTYNSDLFDERFVIRLVATLEVAAEILIEKPNVEIRKLPFLSEPDLELLKRVNRTEFDHAIKTSVVDLFREQLDINGERTAISGADGDMTYLELDTYSDSFAAFLSSKGTKPGDLVGIGVDRGARMMVALLGIWKAGAAYVPLDPDFPTDRLAFMMEAANLSALVTQDSLVSRMPKSNCPRILLDVEWDECVAVTDHDLPPASLGEEIAYVIFTSGSTGRPKGVQVPHRAVLNFLQSMVRKPGIDASDSLLAVTTLSFDISVLELFLPICVGARTVIATSDQSSDGREILRLVHEQDISLMQATPSTWRLMLSEGWLDNDRVWPDFTALCGGEAFPLDLAKILSAGVGAVWNMYGPTETTVWSACKRIDPSNVNTRIGWPIDNTGVFILNEAGIPVPPGVPGLAFHILSSSKKPIIPNGNRNMGQYDQLFEVRNPSENDWTAVPR